MVSLASDNTTAHRFVAQFNESLAAAKMDALALLRDYIAGAESPSLPRDRERRLAAAQVLRTPFLRIDSSGNIANERTRSRRVPANRDPSPDSRTDSSPSSAETSGLKSGSGQVGSRRTSDMGLSPSQPTHGTPDIDPQDPSPGSQIRRGETQDPSVGPVSLCEACSSPRAPT